MSTSYLIAVPQALAPAARQAAATWDPAGADSMFRHPTLYRGDASNLYVFCFGPLADSIIPMIDDMLAQFPGGVVQAAETFEGALQQAGLVRVVRPMP